jgi:hypothetical protein
MTRTRMGALVLGLLALLLALPAGCGQRPPPEADPDKAREALNTALDAWKKGEKPEALQGRSPAIYFNEPQWYEGRKLLDYKVEDGPGQTKGRSIRYSVVLSLEGGTKAQRKVVYQIDTSPRIVIVPAD